MKKTVLLLIVIALGIPNQLLQAQEIINPPDPSDLPPELEIEQDTSADSGSLSLEPIAAGDLQDSSIPCHTDEPYQLFGANIALMESTGTWLRRGFWFAEVDAVISDRIRRRENMGLMQQTVGTTTDQFGRTVLVNNVLTIEGGRQGAEAMPRMKLGRFLFRDAKNRDHTAEFIVYGGGSWSQNGRLDANPFNDAGTTTLQVPVETDRGNASFDGATSSEYQYDSRLNSFELNYHVKARMKRDRMEMEPNGQWVRRAQPSNSHSLIAGLRYFNVSEDLVWSAFGLPDSDNDDLTEIGTYDVETDNHLFGTQVGFTWSHNRARWSIGLGTKGGLFINGSEVDSRFLITGNATSGDNFIDESNISFLVDGSLFARWHLKPNFSLRAGLECMYLSSLALAPEQINFAPTSTAELIGDGDATFLGGAFGFEGYW